MSLFNEQNGPFTILSIDNIGFNCLAERTTTLGCDQIFVPINVFSFLLNENAIGTKSTSSTTSGSYQIADACNLTRFLACTGTGSQDPSQGCPPFVASVFDTTINGGCTALDNTSCALTFLFEIELTS